MKIIESNLISVQQRLEIRNVTSNFIVTTCNDCIQISIVLLLVIRTTIFSNLYKDGKLVSYPNDTAFLITDDNCDAVMKMAEV